MKNSTGHDIRAKLCAPFCAFYKPEKKEEAVCRGFTVVEKLAGQGLEILFVSPPASNVKFSENNLLVDALCSRCLFQREDCDFAAGKDSPPCGGFVLLSDLLKHGKVEIDMVRNAR